ncbi:PQQ-binding-like beta-propeller repeat protein [Seohaeicola nanhaiensis]|uniref:PQQ-binding-like beta-propeller repeat protein n=1 Tax=Seohaeicola nanhaiensis TaxID=1387282 RepID=A0ABV9KJW5_9RHOB
MMAPFFVSRACAAICCAALLLAACSEKEVILPGEREDIRPEGENLALVRTPDEENNLSRAIRLPAQRSNADWMQSAGTQKNRIENPALRIAPQLVWATSIGAGDARRVRITADPVVAGGRVFTLDSGARVSAVSTGGATLWSVDLVPTYDGEEQATGGGLAYDKGTLYVSSGFGRLTALDAATGAIRWQQKLNATGSGTPLINDGLVYLVAGDDTGWAVNASDGKVAWYVNASPSVANVLGAPAPVIAGEFVVFAFGSGELIAAFRRGGLQRWSTNIAGSHVGNVASRYSDMTGSPMVVGNTIYAGNHSGRIAAVNSEDGERQWTAPFGAVEPVWPVGDSVFALTDASQLVRLDARSGEVIWARELPDYVKEKPKRRASIYAHYGPVLSGGRLVVASNDGYLRFFAPEDGSLVATVAVPGGATTAPVVAGNTLYVVSTNGQLLAFR